MEPGLRSKSIRYHAEWWGLDLPFVYDDRQLYPGVPTVELRQFIELCNRQPEEALFIDGRGKSKPLDSEDDLAEWAALDKVAQRIGRLG